MDAVRDDARVPLRLRDVAFTAVVDVRQVVELAAAAPDLRRIARDSR